MNEHLISSKEMAQFVAAGYLKSRRWCQKICPTHAWRT